MTESFMKDVNRLISDHVERYHLDSEPPLQESQGIEDLLPKVLGAVGVLRSIPLLLGSRPEEGREEVLPVLDKPGTTDPKVRSGLKSVELSMSDLRAIMSDYLARILTCCITSNREIDGIARLERRVQHILIGIAAEHFQRGYL